jgi:subtilisin family serine protease
MDPLDQTKLRSLMNITSGIPEVVIGIIDGPVYLTHPALERSKIRTVKDSQLVACKKANSIACQHGTFVAGILCATRGLSAPAICPNCKVILYPIFSEEHLSAKGARATIPRSRPEELAESIIQTIDAGAKIINLSLGLTSPSLMRSQELGDAYDYALKKGVIVVTAAGNQGSFAQIAMYDHRWVIPVAACDTEGRIDPMSNFGHTISKSGLMAPGVNIKSTSPDGKYTQMSGTSVAAPFVTGTIALLWSIFPQAPAHEIINSLISNKVRNRSVIPQLLNAQDALTQLLSLFPKESSW